MKLAGLKGQAAKQLEAVGEGYQRSLLQDVLPFWVDHAIDRECGGFLTALDRVGRVIDTDKGLWTQARFTWLLGKLHRDLEARPEWLDLCRHGVEFLDRFGFDSSDGRMWFTVTREGAPLRKRRYAFTESFAAIAYGEYAAITGSAVHEQKAKECFLRFAEHIPVPKYESTRPTKSLGQPMIIIASAQELRASIGFEQADEWIERSIDEIQRDHCKPDLRCVLETVGPGGEVSDHFDGRTLNPGHAIEGAWFILREAMHRGREDWVELGCNMLDWTWELGWDPEHGGLSSFVDLNGGPPQTWWHQMKLWWPHNEAVLATLYAYRATGKEVYLSMHRQVHDWAHRYFPDSEAGEWFGYLQGNGAPASSIKGDLWKGPFHLPRMQLYGAEMVREIVKG